MNATQNPESTIERPAFRMAFTHRLNCECETCTTARRAA